MKTSKWICMLGLCGVSLFSALPVAGLWHSLAKTALVEDTHENQLYSDATEPSTKADGRMPSHCSIKCMGLRGRRADAALYWKAYVKAKAGHPSDALEACANLRRNYTQSNWLKDCSALEIEIRSKSGSPVQPQAEQDEELKLLALSSMMQGGNSNTLPILQKILEGSSRNG